MNAWRKYIAGSKVTVVVEIRKVSTPGSQIRTVEDVVGNLSNSHICVQRFKYKEKITDIKNRFRKSNTLYANIRLSWRSLGGHRGRFN